MTDFEHLVLLALARSGSAASSADLHYSGMLRGGAGKVAQRVIHQALEALAQEGRVLESAEGNERRFDVLPEERFRLFDEAYGIWPRHHGDFNRVSSAMRAVLGETYSSRRQPEALLEAFGANPDPNYFGRIPELWRRDVATALVRRCIETLVPVPVPEHPLLAPEWANIDSQLRGEYNALWPREPLPGSPPTKAKGRAHPVLEAMAKATVASAELPWETALRLGDDAIGAMPPSTKYRQLRGIGGVLMALAAAANNQRWAQLERWVQAPASVLSGNAAAYAMLRMFIDAQRSGEPSARSLQGWLSLRLHELPQWSWANRLTLLVVGAWLGLELEGKERQLCLAPFQGEGTPPGLKGIAEDAITVLDGMVAPEGSFVGSLRLLSVWEQSLNALKTLRLEAEPVLHWELKPLRQGITIKAMVHHEGKHFSVGESSLVRGDWPLSPGDMAILSQMDAGTWHSFGHHCLLGMIGHPRVSYDHHPCTVVAGTPSLEVEAVGEQRRLRIFPPQLMKREVAWRWNEKRRELTVYGHTRMTRRVQQAFRGKPVMVPAAEEEKLREAVGRLVRSMPVKAPQELGLAARVVDVDATPVLRIEAREMHFEVELRVAPLGLEQASRERPGEGPQEVFGDRGGPLKGRRDFALEAEKLRWLLEAAPGLNKRVSEVSAGGSKGALVGRTEFEILGLEAQLDFLMELGDCGVDVHLEWQGDPWKAPTRVAASQLRVGVKETPEWLALSTELELDDGKVLSTRELLRGRRGRYVALDDGSFVALTQKLSRRLAQFESLGELGGDELRLPAVALPIFDGMLGGAGEVRLDPAVARRMKRLQESMRKRPTVPKGLCTELRSYQKTGFVWMNRLATAGLGAVLADDMGLGKTIQTLALLLSRVSEGPALVVAPASVVENWRSEAERFAPSLKVRSLGELDKGGRGEVLEELRDGGSGQVLLCSYGRLVTEAKALAEVRFGSVVFDEAHYLKNVGTQRSKAAAALRSGFVLSLTGTPIENHLGELHGLFAPTLPGLLGSPRRFSKRFAKPIVEGNTEALEDLRALLAPFVLRRTKEEVLRELPERTDITLRVRPGDDERAFYEGVRQEAADRVKKADAGRMTILTELLRLRQAAVDPRLIVDAAEYQAGASAKLQALIRRLAALKEEGHRALVFSQFLGSLDLIGEALERAGLAFLRLEGKTSTAARKALVARFQGGKGDVFLMSLKAGGVGLNLTGADYVFHVDPWWNPAVEEQASARSHRIGQERPVTIYRLITEGTIEEKILKLHEDKRELAADLLVNMDKAKKLSLAELRGLLG